MSEILAEIRRIVEEDISNRVTQYDVIYEAITNSVHANATKVTCILNSSNKPIEEEGRLLTLRKVDSIKVIDNGDGLHDDNYKSFCKYRSDHKKTIGGKGVGRFTFLKVYEKARYVSLLKSEQQSRSFVFDLDFDTDDLKIKHEIVDTNYTEVTLSTLTSQYFNPDKHLDRRIEMNIEEIREKVLLNLIPTLFFDKKKGKRVEIEFIDLANNSSISITDSDIPDFSEKPFIVNGKTGLDHEFLLYHQIENEDGPLHAYYCANNRTVTDFHSKDFKITLPYGYRGFLLVTGKYFDSHVNNERNDFDIFPIKTDLYSTISWDLINTALKPQIAELVKEGIPETERFNREKLQSIQDERPYLVGYINEDDIDMAGFLDKKQLIDKAKKRFDNAKEKLLANSGRENYTETDLEEAMQVTQNELVSYIFDRVKVIERLKAMVDDQEKVEAVIHNLFMQKYTDDDYFCVNKNNLWLLDDRYTSYSYAASDTRIKEVLKKLDSYSGEEENVNDIPDLSLFFSHDPNNKKGLKSVLIELKPFDYDTKSDKKKFAGIQQLLDYVDAFKDKENIEEVWAFLITDVDEKLSNRLTRDTYVKLFSVDSPIYHRRYDNGVSIYVVSARTLIADAEARNKVFLDIIRKQSKLNKILSSK